MIADVMAATVLVTAATAVGVLWKLDADETDFVSPEKFMDAAVTALTVSVICAIVHLLRLAK